MKQSERAIRRARNVEVNKMAKENIDFMELPVQIEESAGRIKFQINMEVIVKEYEKKMLCTGRCPYTIPMHFLSEGHALEAIYDFTGYIQLKEYAGRKILSCTNAREDQTVIEAVLQILSGILECIKGMENYLIFPERITVHPDVIFIDSNSGRVAMAFYPNESREPLQSRITWLIRALEGMFRSDAAYQYLKKIEDFIFEKNPGLEGMITYLGSLQREVSYIYWSAKNFRLSEGQETIPIHDKTEKSGKRYDFRMKTIAVQIILGAGLIAVFLSGKLSTVSFAGLAVIAAAIDLQILRKRLTI